MSTGTMTAYQSLLVDYSPRPIRTPREHKRALGQIERLMTPHPSREQSELIELLAMLIEQYESVQYPTPQNSPRDMLEHYLENRGLSRAQLARETGIPRATITNILSGRRAVSKTNAVRLAKYFQVPVSIFIEKD